MALTLKSLKQHSGAGTRTGIMGNLVTTAEYAAASYGFGWLAVTRPRVFGFPVALAAGVGLKAVSLGCGLLGYGKYCADIDVLGNAGIGAYANALGASHGAKSAGITRLVLPKGADANKARTLIPGSEVLGAIAAAPQGDLLSANDLLNLARRR